MYKRKLLNALSLCVPALLAGCKMVVLDPKGQIGVNEKSLILTALGLMLIVVIPVIIMAIVFAYRYRASNLKATYKPHWEHSYKIETVVWGVPCLIVLILSTICWESTHRLDPSIPIKSAVKPIEVDVVALDWKWLFIYPEQHIATVNQVAFPVNVPVRFEITSESVMNSFFIPQIGSQIYAMAGMDARLNLIANQIGTYDGLSANFSGDGFSGMSFKALVMSEGDFQKWVTQARLAPGKLDSAAYDELAQPSENNPVQYYSWVEPSLFMDILNKYAKMPMEPMDKASDVKTGQNSNVSGAK